MLINNAALSSLSNIYTYLQICIIPFFSFPIGQLKTSELRASLTSTFQDAGMRDLLVDNVFHFTRHAAKQNADNGGVSEGATKSFMGHKTVSDSYSSKENIDKLTVAAGFPKGNPAIIAYHVAGRELVDESEEKYEQLIDLWGSFALGIQLEEEELARLDGLGVQEDGWNKKTSIQWIHANSLPTLSRMVEV